ncbi:ABC transporter ATP-binding protein [Micromonospora zingiberis]|nr:ABC transporter ATP-binding protein [Micromonospora zingiberis]
MAIAVEIRNVHLSYNTGRKRVDVFSGASLTISEHTVTAIVGPSGGGKSSLLNLVSGIARPDQGVVNVLGTELSALDDSHLADFRAANVGFVFQAFHLVPHIDAATNVALPLLLAGESRRSAVRQASDALDRIGLGARASHRPYQLSGGEQQRVAIARALITNPRLLLADEPTGSLDEQSADVVLDLLLQSATDRTVLLCTHDESVAAKANSVVRVTQDQVGLVAGL